MIGFAEIKVKTEAELKKDWTMYTCNGWIGINKTTGKKIKCGTYHALLTKLSIEDQDKEMKRKHKELPKARNPFVLHLSKRPSGAHGKTKKAERRDERMALRDWIRS